MAAAKNTTRQNTPTEQNKADNELVLYRLQQVENKVDGLSAKLDNQENIKKADLIEFREAILQRLGDVRADFEKDVSGLQKQIDNLKTEKADSKDVKDMKGLIKSLGLAVLTLITSIALYYFTTGRN